MTVRPISVGNPSGDTAKLLILIGLVIQAVEVLVLVGLAVVLSLVPLFGTIVGVLAALATLWLLLVALFSYAPTARAEYRAAQTPTLVFAILSLVTLNLVSGILYLVGYLKLGDAVREQAPAVGAWGGPPWTPGAPPGTRFCPGCGTPNPGTGLFCTSCGRPLG